MLLGLAEAQLAKALAGEAIRTLVEASWEPKRAPPMPPPPRNKALIRPY